MVKQESGTHISKLAEVAAADFPTAAEIRVSFPEQWQHIATIQAGGRQVYIAGLPIERVHSSRHHFEGLSPEINVSLVFYRHYKFFEPWPVPQVTVEWNAARQEGRVTGLARLDVQLLPIGQAQAWFGVEAAVLWECYFNDSQRSVFGQEALTTIWQTVETDIRASKFFTLPYEPAYEGDYQEYLRRVGYGPDREIYGWWSKTIPDERLLVTTPQTPLHDLFIVLEPPRRFAGRPLAAWALSPQTSLADDHKLLSGSHSDPQVCFARLEIGSNHPRLLIVNHPQHKSITFAVKRAPAAPTTVSRQRASGIASHTRIDEAIRLYNKPSFFSSNSILSNWAELVLDYVLERWLSTPQN